MAEGEIYFQTIFSIANSDKTTLILSERDGMDEVILQTVTTITAPVALKKGLSILTQILAANQID